MMATITRSPMLVRVAPFALFMALTLLQEELGDGARYWVYLLKTIVGAGMLWAVRPVVGEARWKLSWAAVAVGVAVFVVWVGTDSTYPRLDALTEKLGLTEARGPAAGWNPHAQFGQGAALAWFFIAARIIGASLVVPPLEEVFYRSFLYRYLAGVGPEFASVPLGLFRWMPFVATSAIFGLEHREWLAGILCGCAYQGLVCAKGRLGDAMAAHAITNLLLGLWVVGRGEWAFW